MSSVPRGSSPSSASGLLKRVNACALAGKPIDTLWVLTAYVSIQLLESYLLTPLIEGRTTSLHPAVVIAAVTLPGSAFGFLGCS